jgi:hypothetical protein
MRTPARRHATSRLTAIGGVNWPIATSMVSSTPNHTGSQANSRISGTSSGRKIRKIDTPSRNMPTTSSTAASSTSVAALPRPAPRTASTSGSARPSVATA